MACFCWSDTCADDSACPTGQTCGCHGSPYDNGAYGVAGSHCVPGDCRVDADCGPCGWCSPSHSNQYCAGVAGYYCHTSSDQCVNDSDCADSGVGMMCRYDTSLSYWRCIRLVVCP